VVDQQRGGIWLLGGKDCYLNVRRLTNMGRGNTVEIKLVYFHVLADRRKICLWFIFLFLERGG
jgi:hypothetical protein